MKKTNSIKWQKKQIKDLLDYERPDKYIVENEQYIESGIPVLTANKSFILGYTDEKNGVYENVPAIIFDDFTTDSKFVDFPFKVKSSAIKILKEKHEDIDLRFIYEQMRSIDFQTGAHKRFYISQYQNLQILVPSLPVQQKIAHILSSVDEAIQITDQIIQKTEKLKSGLMNELLTKGIGHKKFKKTKLGIIPEEWEINKIGNLTVHVGSGITPRGGSSVYSQSGIPFIRSQNVHFDGLRLDELAYISPEIHNSMNRSKVYDNDVLLNITGASIGRCTKVPSGFPESNVNQHVCIIRTNNLINPMLLNYFIQSKYGQTQIMSLQAGGNRQGLNYQQIKEMLICYSKSHQEQLEITVMIKALDEKITHYRNERDSFEKLKDGLTHDIFSQKVEVS